MIIDPFLNNPKTLYYKKFIVSNLQNTEILENLYDEAYDELSEKYPDYSDETLDRLATSLAQGKFEELPEPGDYDD